MTSLEAVSSYVPKSAVPIRDFLRKHGFTEDRIRVHERYFGFSEIPLDPGATLADHLVAAVLAMEDLEAYRPRIRYVVHARTMPVVAPYPLNPIQEVCHRLGLEETTAFSLTQHACASGLLAIDVTGRMLAADREPGALALVLAGEKAFTSAAQVINDTGVMGEGTSAVLVGTDGPRDRVLGYATRTHGKFHGGAWTAPEINAAFHEEYPGYLAEVVEAAVGSAGLGMADISVVLPHNVNRMSWLRVLKRLGIQGADLLYLDNLSTCGHCFGADAFINYRSARQSGRLRRGDRYLMTAVGLGATFSAMVLEH
ncbi:3-oxoacyl-[acyl-carrier-protein] synthase-3 [Sinosporangium album]|uniref:3-oxoacyl-[acyl-carrier-protein] synthase-3 n=1 Tax=Sinosporangium album TaxID=504805 RepID=A0A1G8A861_9ACTN|nr:3-oxoacyl-[acyl-carrier-protein] synthase III C-terminal domain-containing protein [Sinosporangium album]SDH17119.1 3-oxoacyl-[acyl-carrier-protein] synthase-3 [Sinosporangium album]